jgi:hypothetical protein
MRFYRSRGSVGAGRSDSIFLDGITLAITALFAAIFLTIALLGRVEARTGSAGPREMRIIDIWRAALDSIPAEAPAFLTREILTAMMLIAILALSYALAITIRYSRS